MISRGISSTILASLMGHESSAITEKRYIHLFDRQRTDDAVRDAMAETVASVQIGKSLASNARLHSASSASEQRRELLNEAH
jgi:hypothetical protein